MLLLVLGKTERLRAEPALDLLLAIMLLVMTLHREFGFESCIATINVTFKDGNLLRFVSSPGLFLSFLRL